MTQLKIKLNNGDKYTIDVETNTFIKEPAGNTLTVDEVLAIYSTENPSPAQEELTKNQAEERMLIEWAEERNILITNL